MTNEIAAILNYLCQLRFFSPWIVQYYLLPVQLSDFDVTHRVTATACAIDHVPSCCFYQGHPFGFTELLIPKTGMIPNEALVNKLHKKRFFR